MIDVETRTAADEKSLGTPLELALHGMRLAAGGSYIERRGMSFARPELTSDGSEYPILL
jgi:hypothetical protein